MRTIVVDGDLPEFVYSHALTDGVIAMDIETSGLTLFDQADKPRAELGCVTVYVPDGDVYCLRNFYSQPTTLQRIMESSAIRKVFHYALFDCPFIVRDFGFRVKNITCTKIMAHTFDPSKTWFYDPIKEKASHSYAALVYAFVGIVLEKETAISNWFADELTDKQLEYVKNDVIHLPYSYDQLYILNNNAGNMPRIKRAFRFIPDQIRYKLEGVDNVFGYA